MSNDNVFKLVQPGAFDDQLTEILRQGARRAFGDRRANAEVCAPSPAKAAAIARPMPRLPPVTTTTLLSNSPMAESHVSIIVLAASSAKNLDAVTKAIADPAEIDAGGCGRLQVDLVCNDEQRGPIQMGTAVSANRYPRRQKYATISGISPPRKGTQTPCAVESGQSSV